MSFASPLGLLALLAVPAVLLLHLFRRKFRERRVAGLFLFAPDALTAPSGRRRSRLLRTPSLWLELAAALLLGLWLGGLEFGTARPARHVVFVVDHSASIAAVADGRSCAARIRERIAELLEVEPADAFATVILTGPRPEILVGPRAFRAAVGPALADWEPWRPAHDPGPALDLGLELSSGDDDLHFLTDRPARDLPPRYALHALGEPRPNAAILSAVRRSGEGPDQLFIDLMAWGLVPVEERLTVSVRGSDAVRELSARDVELEPQTSVRLTVELPPTPSPVIVALSGEDSLALDDAFTLLPEPRRTVHVATEGLDETLDQSLELERVARSLRQARVVEDPTRAELVFRAAPSSLSPGRHEAVIGAVGAETDAWIGPYLIERRHELASGLTLDGVVWTAGRGPIPGMPLALAGSQPLLGIERLDMSLRLHLNLDVEKSNLTSSPDWPILIDNVVRAVRDRLPGAVEVNVPVGGLLRWRDPGDAEAVRALRLEDPRGRLRPGRGARLVTWVAERPGLHRLVRGDEELARYSVQFVDPQESDLRGARSAFEKPRDDEVVAREEIEDGGRSAGGLEARVLALLLLVALVADWWVLRPRGAGGAG